MQEAWLTAFHRGDRRALEACYREHFHSVDRAVARRLRGPDRDAVVQEVFVKVLSDEAFRRNFQGGDLGAYLAHAATFLAISHARRSANAPVVTTHSGDVGEWPDLGPPNALEDQVAARQFLERFAARVPDKWRAVFVACFLEQLDQRTAARRLGLARTTLAYQVVRIRWLLDRFVREGDP